MVSELNFTPDVVPHVAMARLERRSGAYDGKGVESRAAPWRRLVERGTDVEREAFDAIVCPRGRQVDRVRPAAVAQPRHPPSRSPRNIVVEQKVVAGSCRRDRTPVHTDFPADRRALTSRKSSADHP